MAVERTLSIIKPDATRRNLTGKIIAKFEDAGLKVVASRRIRLSQADAEAFYGVHRERPFFNDLVKFMISGAVVVQVLEGEGHHPQRIRRKHRGQFGARLGRPGNSCQRDKVLFPRPRHRLVIAFHSVIKYKGPLHSGRLFLLCAGCVPSWLAVC